MHARSHTNIHTRTHIHTSLITPPSTIQLITPPPYETADNTPPYETLGNISRAGEKAQHIPPENHSPYPGNILAGQSNQR